MAHNHPCLRHEFFMMAMESKYQGDSKNHRHHGYETARKHHMTMNIQYNVLMRSNDVYYNANVTIS